MWHKLRSHPFAVSAHFQEALVLTYACDVGALQPLVHPGLTLDTYETHDRPLGFLAIAMVQVRRLRPAVLPAWMGQSFFLAGYRLFVKRRGPDGRTRRGLQILQSQTDRHLMVLLGNLFTRYNYRRYDVRMQREADRLLVRVQHGRSEPPELQATAELQQAALPPGSPFAHERDARRFAGPLPWTFDLDPHTYALIAIKGVRQHWQPRLVTVEVPHNRLLQRPPFNDATPTLASAFHVSGIDYHWQRGVRETITTPRPDANREPEPC